MILYFSGTGNSAYAAKRIGAEIGEPAVDLFDKIRNHDVTPLHSDTPWVLVAPTYAWRIPRIVQDWLEQTELTGCRELYVVMTCGGSIGNAGKYVKKLCDAKGIVYAGVFPVVMPENYIALFSTPTKEEAKAVMQQAEGELMRAAQTIKAREKFPEPTLTMQDKLNSGIINDMFYPLFVHAKKFYARDTCISCGKCAKLCPLSNIRMKDGKPTWGSACTHCMACISFCPTEAIEYGRHSEGLPRYRCEETQEA